MLTLLHRSENKTIYHTVFQWRTSKLHTSIQNSIGSQRILNNWERFSNIKSKTNINPSKRIAKTQWISLCKDPQLTSRCDVAVDNNYRYPNPIVNITSEIYSRSRILTQLTELHTRVFFFFLNYFLQTSKNNQFPITKTNKLGKPTIENKLKEQSFSVLLPSHCKQMILVDKLSLKTEKTNQSRVLVLVGDEA